MPNSDLVYSDNIKESEYNSRNGVYAIITHHRGQYVHIVMPKTSAYLVLCEVEVYEGNKLYVVDFIEVLTTLTHPKTFALSPRCVNPSESITNLT